MFEQTLPNFCVRIRTTELSSCASVSSPARTASTSNVGALGASELVHARLHRLTNRARIEEILDAPGHPQVGERRALTRRRPVRNARCSPR